MSGNVVLTITTGVIIFVIAQIEYGIEQHSVA